MKRCAESRGVPENADGFTRCRHTSGVTCAWKFAVVIEQDRQCREFANYFCRGKEISRYYLLVCLWVPGRVGLCMRICACSLVNPACNAYVPCCDVICGSSVITHLSTFSHKGCNFRKNIIEHKMRVFIFSTMAV